MAEIWSEYTDGIIKDVDSALGKKYKFTVRQFLKSPMDYASQPNVKNTAESMRKEINGYLDGILNGLTEQRKNLDARASKVNAITSQLSQNIAMQSKQNKIPMIKPVVIERDVTKEEIIYISEVDTGVLSLIEKLISNSIYIADYTGDYKDYKIGDWFFGSNNKNYSLRVYMPQDQIIMLEGAKAEINGLFDIAMSVL
ncbi:MAG: hypothetical protein M1504_00990 [Candidatus Marsarchaeota archaeon]|nr:hypothetical protein [Candidatus Marsarchaeota archaeon]